MGRNQHRGGGGAVRGQTEAPSHHSRFYLEPRGGSRGLLSELWLLERSGKQDTATVSQDTPGTDMALSPGDNRDCGSTRDLRSTWDHVCTVSTWTPHPQQLPQDVVVMGLVSDACGPQLQLRQHRAKRGFSICGIFLGVSFFLLCVHVWER